jgi:exopolysaccharide biosynthesis polyprenyl glycosylphosphotransferase
MAGKRFRRKGPGRAEAPQGEGRSAVSVAAPPRRAENQARDEVSPATDPLFRVLVTRGAGQLPSETKPVESPAPRDAVLRRALAVADIASAALALLLAIVVLGGDEISIALVVAIPLVVLVGKVIGLYDRDEYLLRKTTLDEAPALFQVATLYTLLIWLGEGAFVRESVLLAEGNDIGRWQVVGLWGLLFMSMLACRAVTRELVRRTTAPERCLVLGEAGAAEQVDAKLRAARALNAIVVGRVPLEAGDRSGQGPTVLGEIDALPEILTSKGIDRVIIAPTSADTEQLLGAIRLVKSFGVKVSVLPRLFEVIGSSVHFDDVEGLMLLGVPRFGLSKSSRLVKRSLDLVVSGIGLVLLAPLLGLIALAIKVNSSGPALFRQVRIGMAGAEFEMLKFRTMHDGADELKAELLDRNEAEGLFKIADDPRVTRVGRALRRFSLDELPQLINVLRGEMSLVGPRPLVTDDDRRVEGHHRGRLDVPPGMTGIWQILGPARLPLNEMVKIDFLYGATWSIWLDLKILLRTVPHVLGRRGM